MNKNIFIGVVVLAIIVVGIFATKQTKDIGANFVGSGVTVSATTTQPALPVLVLPNNPDRRYAVVQNDSDTDIYLHLGFFTDGSAASTTVDVNNGFRLLANSVNEFVINENNLYTGQVWATSTVASKNIIYLEK